MRIISHAWCTMLKYIYVITHGSFHVKITKIFPLFNATITDLLQIFMQVGLHGNAKISKLIDL